MTQSLVTVALFVALLACVPWLVKWVQQRKGLGPGEVGAESKIISAVAVGPHQRVVTVEVGPVGRRVWLTLGVTPQAINCLHTLSLQGSGDGPVPAERSHQLANP
jgi:flagellar protein FliO/FliZ